MGTSRPVPARSVGTVFSRDGWRVSPIALAVLIVLTGWSILYELGNTVLPAMGRGAGFQGVGHDVAFGLAALLLVRRGLGGERGWALIGAGALCWAAGDVYWTYALYDSYTRTTPTGPSGCSITFASDAGSGSIS